MVVPDQYRDHERAGPVRRATIVVPHQYRERKRVGLARPDWPPPQPVSAPLAADPDACYTDSTPKSRIARASALFLDRGAPFIAQRWVGGRIPQQHPHKMYAE